MDFQFYPTPPELAKRMWSKFRNKIGRVLEPEAGTGDLAVAGKHVDTYGRHWFEIDCCEIDATKHGILREKGLNVIGLDFMEMTDGAVYTQCVMNPPYLYGAKHVLKAWNILWDGEISALVNAETVKNPFSQERRDLVKLIEQHGEVEFIPDAFMVEEAERKTSVEVALIYLRKEADLKKDIVGDLLERLQEDKATAESLSSEFHHASNIAIPATVIENAVLIFNAAVQSMRESAFFAAREQYYATLLGETMAVRNGGFTEKKDSSVGTVQVLIANGYKELKDRAWTNVLRSTNVTSRLSSAAQRRIESEFEQIKKLDFTVSNIYGFLCGLIEKQGEIQVDMACDVFDLFTRYHSDNTVFYKGWKSNDRHRTMGLRLKTTRIVLPGHGTESYHHSLRYESERLLGDFDKVFAMLDGKREPETGLVEVFESHFRDLRNGARVSSSYFDVRYYPGAGTIHFFPRDKALVERLNRLVGRHRQWLPPESSRVSESFWLQYDQAEKFDKELRAEVKARSSKSGGWGWYGPLDNVISSNDNERSDKAQQLVDEAATVVLGRHGITVDFQIAEQPQAQHPLMLQAA